MDDSKEDKDYLVEESNSDSTSDSLDSVDPVNPITTATSTDLESNLIASIKLPCNTQDRNNYWLTRYSIKIGNIHTNDAYLAIRYSKRVFHDQPVVMNYFCLKSSVPPVTTRYLIVRRLRPALGGCIIDTLTIFSEWNLWHSKRNELLKKFLRPRLH